MRVRFNNPRLHKGIVCDDFQRLRNARDIENAQAALIVQKSTAHEQPPGSKNLVHILDMFAKKGLLSHRFHGLPSWYKALRSSPGRCTAW
jgi:hypothetical protein